jgi:LPS export ABC transporter protein LptC
MHKASRMAVGKRSQDRSSLGHVPSRRWLLTVVLDAFALAILASCNSGARPTATITAADTADQVLIDMTHYVTNDGVVRARVRGDTAYFYQPTQTAELRNVHVTFYDTDGRQTSTMTAREGTYHWVTGDMEGRGNVVVVGAGDGRTLRSQVMRYNAHTNQVSSDQTFVFDAPGRHVEGDGFTSDPEFRNVTALRPHGTGGKFTLPNQ